jgi:hypothetical protein
MTTRRPSARRKPPGRDLVGSLARATAARCTVLQRRPDAGYTTETILITALLVLLAAATVAVIAAKVLAKAHAISLD